MENDKELKEIEAEEKEKILKAQEEAEKLENEERSGRDEISHNHIHSGSSRQKALFPKAFEVQKRFVNGKEKLIVKASKVDWIHNLVYLDGKKFDFTGRDYLKFIYNSKHPRKLLKYSRQCEKSTMLANEIITDMSIIPYFKCLYVSPSHDQTRQFSNAKLGPWMSDSPIIQKFLQDSSVSRQVFEKSMTNGSIVFLRSAFLNADRTRGISSDKLCISGDSFITMSDGSYKKLSDLIFSNPIGKSVASLNVYSGSQEPAKIIRASINGFKDTVRVDLDSGSRITCTPDHKIYTFNGWKCAGDLNNGDWVAEACPKELVQDSSVAETYGVIGQKTSTKSAKFLSTIKNRGEATAILAGMIASDGHISVGRSKKGVSYYDVGFVTTSLELAMSARRLLSLLGISSRIRDRAPSNGIGKLTQYIVNVRDKTNFKKFMDSVHVPFKTDRALEILKSDKSYNNLDSKSYVTPFSVGDLISKCKNKKISTNTLYRDTGIRLVSTRSKSKVSFDKLKKVASYIKDLELLKFCGSGVKYYKVRSVVKSDPVEVFDITLDRNHNFFANEICVHNCLDEIQDILVSNVPVIMETMSHSQYGYSLFSGTPKTMENTIQQYWDMSSQCEWLIPCDAHTPRHWNYVDEKCIGKKGPICNKCGNLIDPSKGQWVAFSPERYIMGFRVNQVMVPWMYQKQDKWRDLIHKYETYSKALFYNECLALSFDSSTKPVTRLMLSMCCRKEHPFRYRPDAFTLKNTVFAGIDWGEGTDGSERNEKGKVKPASYTVLALGMYITPKHFHIFHYKRFEGKEALPEHCIEEIIQTLTAFRVTCVGVDWGHGWGVNSRLETKLGAQRVVPFQYVGMQRERKKYDDIGHKYQLYRTEVMSDFFTSIRKQEIVWPEYESVSAYLRDFEHIYAEYNQKTGTTKYDHKITEPDDAVHASILCREVADNFYGIKR